MSLAPTPSSPLRLCGGSGLVSLRRSHRARPTGAYTVDSSAPLPLRQQCPHLLCSADNTAVFHHPNQAVSAFVNPSVLSVTCAPPLGKATSVFPGDRYIYPSQSRQHDCVYTQPMLVSAISAMSRRVSMPLHRRSAFTPCPLLKPVILSIRFLRLPGLCL